MHRFVRRLTVLLVVLSLPGLGASRCFSTLADDDGAIPPATALRRKIESIVRQLDEATLAERSAAERSLLDLGPQALTYLPAPELTPNASTREAVKRIRVQLERRAARDSAQASRIRFSGETTVAELLKEFASQTHNQVELGQDAARFGNESLRIMLEDRPFWDCLDEVCSRYQLRADFDPQRVGLALRPRTAADPVELAVQRMGPFRLAIHSVQLLPIVGNDSQKLLRIAGALQLEPRLRPLFLHFAAADVAANTASQTALAPWNPTAKYELPVGDAGREVPIQFDYVMAASDNRPSIDLRGRLFVQLAAGTERIEFDRTALVAGAVRRRGGVTVRLRDVVTERLNEGRQRTEIKLVVTYDAGGPAFESHRTWMFHNAVYLEEDSGKHVGYTDFETSLQVNGAVGVDYRWDQLPDPVTSYRFVYEAPTLIVDLPMEIDLKGLPLKPVTAPASAAPPDTGERRGQ